MQRWLWQPTPDVLKDHRALEQSVVSSPTRMAVYLVLLHYMRIITTFCFIASSVETAPQTKGASVCLFVRACWEVLLVQGGAFWVGMFSRIPHQQVKFIHLGWQVFSLVPNFPLCSVRASLCDTHTPLPGDLECLCEHSPVLLNWAARCWLTEAEFLCSQAWTIKQTRVEFIHPLPLL